MRPVTLDIAGLHSFRERQTIDFTRVTDAGLFGIFGPTGSGKSTILDAMTLALYGKVERSGGNRHGILNQHEPKCHVGLTFEIAQPGGRKRYRVERTYRRKDAFTVQSTHSRIILCEANGDVVLEDKDTAVTECVRRILGLSVEDFTRAVVLPQGKFEQFLKLRGKERRDMLERIFCLDTYGEVLRGQAVSHLQALRQRVERIASQQEMLGEVSQRTVDEAKQQLEAAVQACRRLEQELAAFNREYEKWQTVRQYQLELAGITEQLAALDRERVDVEAMEQKLSRAGQAERVYPFVQTYREWEQQVRTTTEQLEQVKTVAHELHVKRQEAQTALDQAQSEWDQQSPHLLEQKLKGQQAIAWEEERKELATQQANIEETFVLMEKRQHEYRQEAETARERVDAFTKDMARIEERLSAIKVPTEERSKVREAESAERELTTLQRQMNETISRLEQKQTRLHKEAEQWQHAAKQLTEQEQALERLQAEWQQAADERPFPEGALQMREVELREREKQLERLDALYSELQQAENEWQQLHGEIRDNEAKLEQCAEEMKHVQQAIARKQNERVALEERISEQERQHLAAQLAENLTEGEACPVCGASHHPQLGQATGDSGQAGLLKTLEQLQQEITTLEKQSYQLDADRSIHEHARQHKHEWQNKTATLRHTKEQQIDELRQSLPETYRGVTGRDAMQAVFTREREQFQRDSERESAWQETMNQLEENVRAAQMRYQQLREQNIEAEQAMHGAAEAMQEVERTVAEQKPLLQAAQLAWDTVKGAWTAETLTERIAEIAEWDKEREQLEKQRERTVQERTTWQRRLEQAKGELQGVTAELHEIKSERQHLSQQIETIDDRLRAVTGGKSASGYVQEIEAKESLLKERLNTAGTHFQTTEQQWQDAERRLTVLQANKQEQERQLKTATKKVQQQLAEWQFVTIEEAEEARLPEAELQQIRQKIEHYHDLRKQLQHDEGRLRKQLDGRTLSEDDWISLTERKQTLAEKLERAQKNVMHDEHAYQTKVRDFERWQSLERERIAEQSKVDHASDLYNVLRGNAFVEFIAKEHLVHIAADASGHLGRLTRYRYALEIDRDGGFVMRDDANGGLQRPVSTLSGGETFLTSLSLALALSSQIQLKGECPLEFFFLDEGFGTLDSELLDTVISSLEKCHFGHMTIGLISHVPELQNRLHRQIQVIPAAGRDGTRVQVANM